MKVILPHTEKMALKTLLVMIVLGMSNWSCAGRELSSTQSGGWQGRGSWPVHLTPGLTVFRVLVCPGFPVYDYNLASLRQALAASVADVNARSLSPYLLRAFGSSVKRVSAQCLSSTPLATAFCLCSLVSALGTLF